MRAQAFTNEEVEILRNNRYTAYVSNCSIRFTLEFKEMFMERKGEGIPARRIFQEAGYDVDILGTSRIKNLSKRIPKEASAPCGLHEGYHIHMNVSYAQTVPSSFNTSACFSPAAIATLFLEANSSHCSLSDIAS